MEEPVVLNVAGEIGQFIASAPQDGDELRELIMNTLNRKKPVTLDFISIDLVTAPFLNASIGPLYSQYDLAFLEKYLKFVNLTPVGETILRSVQDLAGNIMQNVKSINSSKIDPLPLNWATTSK
jgi:hypothetical protein